MTRFQLPRALPIVAATVAVVAGASVSACGGSDSSADTTVETGSTLACCGPDTTPVDTTIEIVITIPAEPLPESTTEPVSSQVAVVVTEPKLDGVMPDVLCMDLQDAQNLIQTRGVFFSRSEDASGDGRRQIVDRNWIVVGQTPAAGEPIGEGDAVLSVLKDDEVAECTPGIGGS